MSLKSDFLRLGSQCTDGGGVDRVVVHGLRGDVHIYKGPYVSNSSPSQGSASRQSDEPAPDNKYTRCCADVLFAIRDAGRRLPMPELLAALAAQGHEWSERHVRRALKVLRGAGVACHPGEGYGFSSAN